MDIKNRHKLKQISVSWYFLIIVILAYALVFNFKKSLFFSSLNFFSNIILKIIPIFVFVFALMTLTNYLITPKFIMKYLGNQGITKWLFVIIGGILSSGPIYIWYPLMADLKNKGFSYGLIACFLYNRAIKIQLLPIAIFYFGIRYILVLTFVMVFVSVFQGILLDKLLEVKKMKTAVDSEEKILK
ncbi:MAG: hypothetical protein PHD13_07495 [Methanocellales archaeon]|nr:hypothetical protein [Methanocellales archaeon]MDD3292414.1 hypothetical protein [Methanocellales archaeon]MDD5236000.1 hypothetical protein [Methanocellales archaeon]MDD5485894.1 hypothetical protein [Methanocellales archaeon]